jgi:FkbM family methyltransferase
MKIDDVFAKALDFSETPKTLANIFLDKSVSRRRYAVGKNNETLELNRLIPLDGIVDDYSVSGAEWHGIPLIKIRDVQSGDMVANCSSSISPIAVLERLESSQVDGIVGIHELIIASNGLLGWPEFVKTMHLELENIEKWQEMYDSFSDEESRRTFLDIAQYRLTANPKYMENYRVRIDEQYFEDFMQFSNEIFVDAGGFDGDTSEIFANRYSDYRKILFFEPSSKNMAAALKRLVKHERIEFYSIGLSNAPEMLQFNQDAGSASSVTEAGSETINVDMLDKLLREPVTFIKMDLEGWELKALEGARQTILSHHPKLAIAVYHNSQDFRVIFEYIRSLGLGYEIFLRHYTQGWSETIMFFLPRK